MLRAHWLKRFGELCGRHHGTNAKVLSKRRRLDVASQPAEMLEERAMLSVSALFVNGEVNLVSDGEDAIRVSASATGNLLVETGSVVIDAQGVPTAGTSYVPFVSLSSIPAINVTSLIIEGSDQENVIDVSRLTAAVFGNLQSIEIDGQNGNDLVIGSDDFGEQVRGDDGTDVINTGDGDNLVDAGDGNDTITGGADSDRLDGGDGNDVINAGAGNDTVQAGNGEDTVSLGDGDDSVFAGNGEDSLNGDAGNDTLNGDGGTDTVSGGDGNDSILGGEFADSLVGGAGNDTLIGNSGNDTLIGVTGFDRVEGGAGNDLIQSALDITEEDPVPAPAQPGPTLPTAAPLPDAVDSTLGVDTASLSHTISSGAGDGGLTVQVTSTGAFGFGSFPNSTAAGAPYDPLGAIAANDTTFDSEVYFRASTISGTRATLESLATNSSTIRGRSDEANSTFDIGVLQFVLTQFAEPVFDLVTGLRLGSLLTQTYRITNTDSATSDFELARYFDGDLRFDGSLLDGGGRFVSTAGDEFLFETDAGGTTASTNFVGITAKGGTIPATNRFEIDQFPTLQGNIQSGQALDGLVFNDTDGDQSIDVNYNVTLGFRNTFRLPANASATYTTHTLFGTGTPNQIEVNQPPVAVADMGIALEDRAVAIDVVSNDFDVDGSLVYSSIQIVQQAVFGSAIPLGDGRIVYIPDPGFSGTDTFAYTIADNLGATSSPAIVTLIVNAVDRIGDELNAGVGNDTVIGSDGNDTIFGGAGRDSLIGGLGNDRIQGQGGSDTITGEGGADVLDGGAGDDLVRSLEDAVVVIPDIAINDVSVIEGNFGIQSALVIVTLSQATTVPVRVLLTTTDNVAQAGSDYAAITLFVTIPVGQTTTSVAIPILGDAIYEADETFFVNLLAPQDGNLIDAQATVTITNDDATAATQSVFVDFDSQTAGTDHVYTASERSTIIARLQAVYSAFPVTFTATAPAAGPFNTITINEPPPGGLASEIDFRNLNYTATATVDINGFLGSPGAPSATSANFVELTFKVVAHENGHVLGLRHDDSFGPIGSGISSLVNPANFNPPYPGPLTANESTRHIMGSPAATGETLFDAISGQFFGEREAVKLSAWAFGGAVTAEQATGHGTIAAAQPIQLRELFVPNTLVSGSNLGQTFRVHELTVTGAIGAGAENDIYQFQGTAGQLLNLEVISQSVSTTPPPGTPRYANAIDAVIQVLDSSGNLIPYYAGSATNNDGSDSGFPDPDSILFDLRLPSTGTFYIQVNAATAADTGNYELYVYDFSTFVPAVGGVGNVGPGSTPISAEVDTLLGGDGNDTLLSASGDDILNGNAGDDLLEGGGGNDSMLGGSGSDTLLGGDGNDTLFGQGGDDTVDGGAGDDRLVWRSGIDGSDLFLGTAGFDSVDARGTAAADVLTVAEALTFVTGSSTISSSDLMISDGIGSIVLDDTRNSGFTLLNVEIHGLGGNDQVTVGNINHIGRMRLSVFGEEGDDSLNATGAQIGDVRLLLDGGADDDTLKGSLGNDTLLGQEGHDSLLGRAGDDTLDGGLGDDTLAGEDGDDVLVGRDGNDLLVGQNGNDSISGGFGDDTIDGGAGADTLRGEVGDDVLNGAAGNDLMFGASGQDQMLGGAGDDSLDGGRNNDTLNGNSGHDSLIGDHGDDLLVGADGNDTLQGSDGHDTLDAGNGNNALNGGNGNDLMRSGDGDDTLLGGDGNDTLLAGAGQDIVLGEDGDDVVNGQGGTDIVAGNQGNDNVADAASEINELFRLPINTLNLLFKSLMS